MRRSVSVGYCRCAEGRVNEAIEEMVVKRYGPPQFEQREGDQTVWTHPCIFENGMTINRRHRLHLSSIPSSTRRAISCPQ